MQRKVLSAVVAVAVGSLSVAGFADNFQHQSGDLFIMGGVGQSIHRNISVKNTNTGSKAINADNKSVQSSFEKSNLLDLSFGTWLSSNVRIYTTYQYSPKKTNSAYDTGFSEKASLQNQSLAVSADWVHSFGVPQLHFFVGGTVGANRSSASYKVKDINIPIDSSNSKSDIAPMYGVQAGIGYDFTSYFGLELGYQYRILTNKFTIKNSVLKIKEGNQQNLYLNAVFTF